MEQTWVAWALKHSRLRRFPCLLVLLINLGLLNYEILINNILKFGFCLTENSVSAITKAMLFMFSGKLITLCCENPVVLVWPLLPTHCRCIKFLFAPDYAQWHIHIPHDFPRRGIGPSHTYEVKSPHKLLWTSNEFRLALNLLLQRIL